MRQEGGEDPGYVQVLNDGRPSGHGARGGHRHPAARRRRRRERRAAPGPRRALRRGLRAVRAGELGRRGPPRGDLDLHASAASSPTTSQALARALADTAAAGLARLEAEARARARARQDEALVRAARALNASLELGEVLRTLAREAALAVDGAITGVYLGNAETGGVATAGHNVVDGWHGLTLAAGEGAAGQALATGRVFTTNDYHGETGVPAHETAAPVPLRRRRPDGLERRAQGRAVGRLDRAAPDRGRGRAHARGDRRPRDRGLLQRGDLRGGPAGGAHRRPDRPAQPRRDAGPPARGDRPRAPRGRAAGLRDPRPRRLQARQRLARPPGRRRAPARRGGPAAGRAAALRPGRPLRRRRVRAAAARQRRGDGLPGRRARPRRRRGRGRAGLAARARRRLLARRRPVARAAGRRGPARARRPRADARQAHRQGPRRGGQRRRRARARAAARRPRLPRRGPGARGGDRGARPLHARALRRRSSTSPAAWR